jgi:DNA-binding beta-propeller fold protein YncE
MMQTLMKSPLLYAALVLALIAAMPGAAWAEILAMVNYETKSPESLKALKNPVTPKARREGIAVIDVDPQSKSFGKIVKDIKLPADVVAHHIFYNRDSTKAYVTALGKPELRVIDMKTDKLPMKTIAVADCQVGEDVVFSANNKKWFLSCMGSNAVVVGDAVTDKPLQTITLTVPYPHGIAIHDGIDRILTSSTVRATDLGDAGEALSVIEASTGKVLGSVKVSNKPTPARAAPVEVTFLPGSNPPLAYVTNMFEGTLWTVAWNPTKKDFDAAQAFDFASVGAGMPLEIYFNDTGDRLYVSTAKPGHLHIFDISKDRTKPQLLTTIVAAEGAHHVAFTKDWRYAFIQNALLNLPGMSDGAITVVDLQSGKAVRSVDTLKNQGLNPNSIVLLPKWNHLAGH